MAKNLFTLTVKTTTPADSELLVGGTGSANAYNFTWTKLRNWIYAAGSNNFTTTGAIFAALGNFNSAISTPIITVNETAAVLGTEIGVDYRIWRSGDASAFAGVVGFKAEGTWTTTASTRDSTFFIKTVLDGSLIEAITLSSNKNLSIKDGTADGTTANQASFYVLSGEMWVKDGGGTASQLSSHPSDAPEWMYDDDPMPPQINKEMNDFDGIVRYTNNTRKNILIEKQFAGETLPTGDAAKITFIETYDEHNERTGNALVKDNWEDFQEREYQRSLDLIAKYEQAKKDFKPTKEVKEFTQIKPEVYVKVAR